MMSFYGHDNNGARSIAYPPRTKFPRSLPSPLEAPSAPTSIPNTLVPHPLENTALVKSAFYSPPSSSSSSPISVPRISQPEVAQHPPRLAEEGPHTPEHRVLTPPTSSRVLRTLTVPRPPSPRVPTTLEETRDMIAAFINSGHTRPLSIPLTDDLWTEFLDARDAATHGSDSFLLHLRFTYDASTSTLITRCMPSPIHDAAQVFFQRRLKRLIIERRISYADSTRFELQTGTDVGRFSGDRAGSRKQPDIAVIAAGDDDEDDLNSDFPLVTVEVGFSEGYDALKKDMKLWLIGSEGKVRVVVLISLLETPQYQAHQFLTDDDSDDNPGDGHGSKEDVVADAVEYNSSGASSSVVPAAANPPPSTAPYGPYLHNNLILVGSITGFLELWRLDPTTKLPVRTLHRDIFPTGPPPYANDNFELTMLDLFGWPDRVPQACTPDESVVFELAEYRKVVAKAVLRFARLRLDKVEKEKRKMREGEGERGDGDWRGGKRRRV